MRLARLEEAREAALAWSRPGVDGAATVFEAATMSLGMYPTPTQAGWPAAFRQLQGHHPVLNDHELWPVALLEYVRMHVPPPSSATHGAAASAMRPSHVVRLHHAVRCMRFLRALSLSGDVAETTGVALLHMLRAYPTDTLFASEAIATAYFLCKDQPRQLWKIGAEPGAAALLLASVRRFAAASEHPATPGMYTMATTVDSCLSLLINTGALYHLEPESAVSTAASAEEVISTLGAVSQAYPPLTSMARADAAAEAKVARRVVRVIHSVVQHTDEKFAKLSGAAVLTVARLSANHLSVLLDVRPGVRGTELSSEANLTRILASKIISTLIRIARWGSVGRQATLASCSESLATWQARVGNTQADGSPAGLHSGSSRFCKELATHLGQLPIVMQAPGTLHPHALVRSHARTVYKSLYPAEGSTSGRQLYWQCDMCKQEFKPEVPLFHCAQGCWFDACERCVEANRGVLHLVVAGEGAGEQTATQAVSCEPEA